MIHLFLGPKKSLCPNIGGHTMRENAQKSRKRAVLLKMHYTSM